ncbi:hypothetical protein PINS_up022513 [Pythium insidiosum]|nr:hypothetical protein PINS_up022513 [Pythium insidiosum]
MLEDMKVMGGTIQDAFVSIWLLDLSHVRPFFQGSKPAPVASRPTPVPAAAPAVVRPPHQQGAMPLSARHRPSSGGPSAVPARSESRPTSAHRPITPGTAVVAPTGTAVPPPVAVSTPPVQPRVNFVEDPRRSGMHYRCRYILLS